MRGGWDDDESDLPYSAVASRLRARILAANGMNSRFKLTRS